MFDALAKEWRLFKAGPVGHRFEKCYERHQDRAPWTKVMLPLAAAIALAIGVVLVFIPGPAVVFFGISAALLACLFRPVANSLDKTEVWLRKILRRFGRAKRRRDPSSTKGQPPPPEHPRYVMDIKPIRNPLDRM